MRGRLKKKIEKKYRTIPVSPGWDWLSEKVVEEEVKPTPESMAKTQGVDGLCPFTPAESSLVI